MTGAMMGMVITLAPSLGPTIGGLVAETLGWRALFWVNVVPGDADHDRHLEHDGLARISRNSLS
jgi:hypothetical protein